MEKNDKPYRTLAIRLSTNDFAKFERIQKILEEKAKRAGLFTSMKKPDVMKHLIETFFESENTVESDKSVDN